MMFLRLEPDILMTPPQTNFLWQAAHPLESELSSTTVIVNHHAQPSLTFTASIEDYAHKADPKNWGPLKFKKGQSVRIRPGT